MTKRSPLTAGEEALILAIVYSPLVIIILTLLIVAVALCR